MPKISVIMPAYNAERYIREAIDSILCQSFRDFELIVLNDCSRDGTEGILLSYDDPRLVYVKNEENLGVARTLNKGLALAKGQYIARMDADDISLPERFRLQAAYLDEHPAVAVVGADVETFDGQGSTQVLRYHPDSRQMKIDLLFASPLVHPSVMMRRTAITQVGGYDGEFEGLEDYELWCRVADRFELAILPQVLLRYRVHPGQVTQQPSPKKRAIARRIKARRLERLGLPAEGPAAEGYYGFRGRTQKTYEQVLAECRFFEAALAANEAAGIYDAGLLKSNFRQLAKSGAMGLSRQEQRQLCSRTRLLSRWQLALSGWKQILRGKKKG